jgi:aminoglycoside phosphotransferase (APT) family kinase protein
MAEAEFQPVFESALKRGIAGFERLTTMTRLSGGASQETWSFDAIVDGKTEPLILRRSPGGLARVTEGSSAVPLATEALAIEESRKVGVAAPRVRYVLQDSDGVGQGYVMERLPGETIARKILRDKEFDAVRPKLAAQCGEILARIHAVELTPALRAALPVVDGPSQLQHYRQLYDTYDYPHPVFEMAFKWLEPRLAGAARQTLVHGDFRHGNILISPERVEAALDWELCHIGDPLEDIGWICTNTWRFGAAEKVVGGFGDLKDLLAGYEAAGGAKLDEDMARTWIVYGSLKWGVMCMSMYQGFKKDGSVERAAIGRRSSETEIDLVNLIIGGKI